MFSELERGWQNTEKITQIIRKRAIVFPSGTEVEAGEIEDTNTPLLISKLTEAGFTAEAGPVLKDDLDLFTGKLRRAMDGGYGVLITTGGVGAENKDFSVEVILRLDPAAATPYIAKFKVGEGRHRKEGIRIAVGRVGFTTLVALPGPNDEVALCADCLIEGLTKGWSKEVLAGQLAKLLRARLSEKMTAHHGHAH
ncbi:MAG: molybdopterin-binding protein [Oscillospiraceae bacterium]